MKTIPTPAIDAILLAQGWTRPTEAAVYIRRNEGAKKPDPFYTIICVSPSDNLSCMEEGFRFNVKDSESRNILVRSFEKSYDITHVTTEKQTLEILMRIVTDFYAPGCHDWDPVKHELYKKQYEALSGYNYETGNKF